MPCTPNILVLTQNILLYPWLFREGKEKDSRKENFLKFFIFLSESYWYPYKNDILGAKWETQWPSLQSVDPKHPPASSAGKHVKCDECSRGRWTRGCAKSPMPPNSVCLCVCVCVCVCVITAAPLLMATHQGHLCQCLDAEGKGKAPTILR